MFLSLYGCIRHLQILLGKRADLICALKVRHSFMVGRMLVSNGDGWSVTGFGRHGKVNLIRGVGPMAE